VNATGSASDAASDLASDQPALARQLRALAALAVPALMFWYVGYWAIAPVDPFGPVSILLASNPFLAMVEIAALGVVSAGLAVAINGPRSAMFGPLGIAVGLASVSIRGGDIDLLPLCLPAGSGPWPIRSLIFEFWLWLGLIAVGAVVGRWIDSWSSGPDSGESATRDPDDQVVDSAAELRRALLAIVVVTILAFVLVRLLAGGPVAPILKGQIFFSVAGGFYAATVLALTFVRLRSPLWLFVALALVGSAAYIIGSPHWTPTMVERGIRLVIPGIARPTPIQFAALGSAGIVSAFLTAPGLNFLKSDPAR